MSERSLRYIRREVHNEVCAIVSHLLSLHAYVERTGDRFSIEKNERARSRLKKAFIRFEIQILQAENFSIARREEWYKKSRYEFMQMYG